MVGGQEAAKARREGREEETVGREGARASLVRRPAPTHLGHQLCTRPILSLHPPGATCGALLTWPARLPPDVQEEGRGRP